VIGSWAGVWFFRNRNKTQLLYAPKEESNEEEVEL